MNHLNTPEEFDFPFTPYNIQDKFMRNLFETLENRKFGIFESPTGTGKSLSILCGALRWLKDYNKNEFEVIKGNISEANSEKDLLKASKDDWIASQAKEISITRKLNELKLESDKIENYYKKIEELKKKKKKYKLDRSKYLKKAKNVEDEVDEFGEKKSDNLEDDLLLAEIVDVDEEENEDEIEDKYAPVKIFICSRTHSQLAQFIGEINKSPFAKDVRVVTLGSRQNYCINPDVNRLKNISLVNERCLDLQKSQGKATKKEEGKVVKKQKSSSNCKCPYYKQQTIEELKDVALLEVCDIEDLISSGKELKACPYYASRKAVEDAEVVLVPYNTILHKATREANGIKLKNNVVIIDEAHNLLEAMAQMYSAEVTSNQLVHAQQQLKGYKAKYSTRFSSQNLLCINQLIYIITALKDELERDVEIKGDIKTEISTLTSFVLTAGIDNYNMFKLIKFAKDSKISQKLHSFAIKFPEPEVVKKEVKKGVSNFLKSIEPKGKSKAVEEIKIETPEKPKPKQAPSNPLLSVISFLEALTYSYEDGRILIHRGDVKKYQFLLLNPSIHFADVVKEARSVIVAGGTMKPISEFRDRLFINAGAESSRIVEFSCDHIIPPKNILPIIVTSGPAEEKLLFNFDNRRKMGLNVKLLLQETCRKVKGGIVVFFPSYKYEAWIWDQVKNMKFGRPVFREPQESGSVDSVLDNYHKAIYKSDCKSAMLFSVVGGKLSEGLNFSDDLGRCVIVVGMPYANIYAPDLKEKMSFLDKKEGSGSGNKFYENMCMKAVNQCIGRAVRHKDDFASVLLLDERYARQATKNALPDWIKRSLRTCKYDEAFILMDKFFTDKSKPEE
ncbi:PREDICTED: putative ATP-dependent RNA helicase DDX11-like protein 8 [Nicrophorus vespilloides]|uniref:ATP-dependent RNA helicase DDX11-like protein 8 n=1 Tax=Nicrophorus vespilloides TaxID=110193 RepID=A0ABM1M4W3_NICVS|nr:PREDICTED: putative ATP-dependent RNA helicase DDX11-like protein 8 [Nicrophorus vespilloides]